MQCVGWSVIVTLWSQWHPVKLKVQNASYSNAFGQCTCNNRPMGFSLSYDEPEMYFSLITIHPVYACQLFCFRSRQYRLSGGYDTCFLWLQWVAWLSWQLGLARFLSRYDIFTIRMAFGMVTFSSPACLLTGPTPSHTQIPTQQHPKTKF